MLRGPQWVWWNESTERLRSANAIRLTIDKTRVVCDPPDPFCPLDLLSTTSLVPLGLNFCDNLYGLVSKYFEIALWTKLRHPVENIQKSTWSTLSAYRTYHHWAICFGESLQPIQTPGISHQVKRLAWWRSGFASQCQWPLEKCHVVNPTSNLFVHRVTLGIWNRRKTNNTEVALLQIFGRLTPNQRTCSNIGDHPRN
jgi:hypothetical protein